MRTFFASISLRIGLAFTFLYAAISGVIAPRAWIGFFPDFLRNAMPAQTLLIVFGIFEAILAILILFKRDVAWPALIASFTLLAIVFFNIAIFDLVFRDIGLALAALALFALARVRS